VEIAERLPGNGAVTLRLELAAAAAGRVVAETAQVRAAAVVVLKLTCTISRVAWRRITTWKNTDSSRGSGTWNKVSS